ncbi:hypothetical protein BY458DRAFT_510890 [Sporodiniella umbellata]|nr:hypothetical protein BY458DRAFT_510890 [Sporodiniella umbellata]
MDLILSVLLGATLTYYTAKEILSSITPWSEKMIEMCFHPANNDTCGNLRVVYSGVSSKIDRTLCTIVNAFQNNLHDDFGGFILTLLIAAFGTALIVMAIEGSRHGSRKTLLGLFPFYGILANLFGIYAVFSLLWIPLSTYYRKLRYRKSSYWNISQPQVYGICSAVFIGFGLPSAFFLSPKVKEDTRLEQDLIAIWQLSPVVVALLIPVLTTFYQLPSEIDRISDRIEQSRLYALKGQTALKRVYCYLGLINMAIYYGVYAMVRYQGIHIWDSFVLLYHAPENLPTNVSFGDLGQILTTRTAMINFAALSLSFALWAAFDCGIDYGVTLFFFMPLVGPSAAISFYAYYRESLTSDSFLISKQSPPPKRSLTKEILPVGDTSSDTSSLKDHSHSLIEDGSSDGLSFESSSEDDVSLSDSSIDYVSQDDIAL